MINDHLILQSHLIDFKIHFIVSVILKRKVSPSLLRLLFQVANCNDRNNSYLTKGIFLIDKKLKGITESKNKCYQLIWPQSPSYKSKLKFKHT
jgi:hypothetical protein